LKLIGGMHGAKWYEGFLTVSRWSGQLEPNGFGKVARIERRDLSMVERYGPNRHALMFENFERKRA
jgi:hypothetical protein